MKTTKIELYKEDMKFSAGHFTIFSANKRENFHGHNFRVYGCFELPILENGMAIDYGELKSVLRKECQ